MEIGGRPLISWQFESASQCGLTDVCIVAGYCSDQLQSYTDNLILNPDFETTNMVSSLFCAEKNFGDDFIMSYGDTAFHGGVLARLLASDDPVSVVIDKQWLSYWEKRFDDPLEDAESLKLNDAHEIIGIGQKPSSIDEIDGQYIGLVRFKGAGVEDLRRAYRDCYQKAPERSFFMTDLLQNMIDSSVSIRAVDIEGGWVEIDNPRDLELAERLVSEGRLNAERPLQQRAT
jgi:choline kinase